MNAFNQFKTDFYNEFGMTMPSHETFTVTPYYTRMLKRDTFNGRKLTFK